MRLGELAQADGLELRLRVTGGAVMMIAFNARTAGTRDVDVLRASHTEKIEEYGAIIAAERGWPPRWLNTDARKFEDEAPSKDDEDVLVQKFPGLVITRPSLRPLLAWKLARYADDLDQRDARELLRRILDENPCDRDSLWLQLEAHLVPSEHQEACYNLEDAWDELHGAT